MARPDPPTPSNGIRYFDEFLRTFSVLDEVDQVKISWDLIRYNLIWFETNLQYQDMFYLVSKSNKFSSLSDFNIRHEVYSFKQAKIRYIN